MIKAVYTGVPSGELLNGRVYKISTRCSNGYLLVYVSNSRRQYRSLEAFRKEWKVKAVYHE